jgi:hypothetical protein
LLDHERLQSARTRLSAFRDALKKIYFGQRSLLYFHFWTLMACAKQMLGPLWSVPVTVTPLLRAGPGPEIKSA